MNWISWVIIAILAAASGVVAYCWRKGYIKADSAVRHPGHHLQRRRGR